MNEEQSESVVPPMLNRAVLRLIVLSAVGKLEPIHGYGLLSHLHDSMRIGVKGGAVYPLLNALESEGLLRSVWLPGESGPGRKTYELTDAGMTALAGARDEWGVFSAAISAAIG